MSHIRDTYWCAIAEVLHIPPSEIDSMTVERLYQAQAYIDRRNADIEKANGG